MLSTVERKYFYEIGLTCRRCSWKVCDEVRHAIHRWALGQFKSHKLFTAADYDRIFTKLIELRDPNNLSAVMEVLAFVNHDVAQARHVPVVRPGKAKKKYDPLRKRAVARPFASFYERMTGVDDPGERKRLCYVLERLFQPALVDKVCFDRWERRNWRELPLPQLTELRDLLKARLGKFITRVKAEGHAAFWQACGFSSFNPETGRDFPNEAIIKILLRRGQAVDMRAKKTGAAPATPAMNNKNANDLFQSSVRATPPAPREYRNTSASFCCGGPSEDPF